MSDSTPSDDLQHLPTADATDARAAKAALWKEIANRKKQSRMAPAEPPVPVSKSSTDEWAELFAMNPEEAAATSIPLPAAPAPAAKRRSVIRRSTPLVVPAGEPVEPEPPVADSPAESKPISRQETLPKPPVPATPDLPAESRKEETPSPPKSEDKVDARPETSQKSDLASGCESIPTKVPALSPPKNAESEPSEAPGAEVHFLIAVMRQKWVQWGGASLSLSLGIHALILGVGGFLVINQVMLDQAVDFLPGGTKQGQEASQSLEHKIQQKKQPWLKKSMPLRKIAAVGSISDIVLPDEVPDLLDLPSANDMLTTSKLGGAGLGGGGFGKGMGLGAKGGMVFQPLSMFGREIKAKRLAVVLDVSSSMAPHLPRVIAELDKVARGSVVVLFPGCGLDSPPKKGLDGEEVYRTNGAEFERFWRMGGMASLADTRTFKFSRSDPIPSESIFELLSKRSQTHFVHYVGTGYTWTALLSEQVRQADALYWFSDFQDHVDFSQLEIVRENLMRRKQKLYIQPYMHGSSFDLIKSQLVDPTGGEVIEAVME